MTDLDVHPLPPERHACGEVSWTVTREQVVPTWAPLRDEKGRAVHGYAVVSETPEDMRGRKLPGWTISAIPFSVRLVATRDGRPFGALSRQTLSRQTWHATRALAIEHARHLLKKQGKRYVKKYGSPPGSGSSS